MKIELGAKIRELRHRDSRTQEALANAIGVTCQAVSRWEANGGYPDMEILPSIANYFGITIDELFGYEGDREYRINEIITKAYELGKADYYSDDINLDERINILRNGLAEFPGNEKLMLNLAELLDQTGHIRYNQKTSYNEDGYLYNDVEYHKKDEYWSEAIKLFETLVNTAKDKSIVNLATNNLIYLLRNTGEYSRAVTLADTVSSLRCSKEITLTLATDGVERAKYIKEAILVLTRELTEQMMQSLMIQKSNFDTDIAVKTVKNAIDIIKLVIPDGNYGEFHAQICDLYLYLSEHQWRLGEHDETFESLDYALYHAKQFDNITQPANEGYTKHLPKTWPQWCLPECSDILQEMQQDPRWNAWIEKTQE